MDKHSESTFMEFILYNNWANQQVLKACQKLSEEQLATPIPGGYGTIRGTLQHIITGEEYYLKLLTGNSPQPPFKWEANPSLIDMTDYAALVGRILVEMVSHTLPSKRVTEEDEGKEFHYQALLVFIQIINHGVEHRTNITTILNQGMMKPPNVDGWGYMAAQPERFEVK